MFTMNWFTMIGIRVLFFVLWEEMIGLVDCNELKRRGTHKVLSSPHTSNKSLVLWVDGWLFRYEPTHPIFLHKHHTQATLFI